MTISTDVETVEDFTIRARQWLSANMPPAPPGTDLRQHRKEVRSDEEELARISRCRELQRLLFDGGLAGVCVPKEYGGQGLTVSHQEALNREIVGYDYPAETQVPTFTPCLAVLLDFGTDEQKRRFIPPILKGDAFWMQFMSEPSGGSDAAGALTTAVRDGDEWVVNGSKIWTSGAWWADWGLLLARTNWDVPKHRGLSVFVLPIHQPTIEIHRIEMLDGSKNFCQEFLTDVRIPDADRIGEVDQGWSVGVRWMYHERTVSGGSPYLTRPAADGSGEAGSVAALLARSSDQSSQTSRSRAEELIGEARALELVGSALTRHITRDIATGRVTDQAASITRLFSGTAAARTATIGFELAGSDAVAWSDADEEGNKPGVLFLMRQAASIGGGTTEMSRNVISERVLGMPREPSFDKDIAFRDVPRNAAST